jgi:hypothetical protein
LKAGGEELGFRANTLSMEPLLFRNGDVNQGDNLLLGGHPVP